MCGGSLGCVVWAPLDVAAWPLPSSGGAVFLPFPCWVVRLGLLLPPVVLPASPFLWEWSFWILDYDSGENTVVASAISITPLKIRFRVHGSQFLSRASCREGCGCVGKGEDNHVA